MLYKIDLRLKEFKQNEDPFGGVALFCFGDMLQIKPVKGKYIFEEPKGRISNWDFLSNLTGKDSKL